MRTIGTAVGFVLIVALLLLAMHALAARITAAHLLDEARLELTTLKSGQPLWQWRLRRPHDLVAGRAFGQARVTPNADGLRITSLDGTPFELGLPIASMVDLAHWPILRLQLRSDALGTVGLIRQDDANVPGCLATSATTLSPDARELRLDLRRLNWRSSSGGLCPALGNAMMLRLRVQLPRGASLQWSEAALLTADPTPVPASTSIVLPVTVADREQVIATAFRDPDHSAIPVFRLPVHASAETQLALRDRLRRHWPAALIVPANAIVHAVAHGTWPAWLDWAICLIYLWALAGLVLRQPRGPRRDWLDIAACMAGPLWLIAGLQWGPHTSWPGVTAFAAALLYAGTLELRQRPHAWHWLGRDAASWAWPLALLPIGLCLLAVGGHGFKPPAPAHVLSYLLWAALQQWLMLAVVLRRLERLAPPAWAILLTAVLFGLLHTPNGRLMQLCLLAELWWAWCFLRSRSLLPIAVAHAACALLVEAGLTGGLLRSLEVSARFFS